jgi:hypothetical protein
MPAPIPMKPDDFRKKVAEALVRMYGLKPEDANFCVHYYKEHIANGLDAPDYDYRNYGKLAGDYAAFTSKRIWDALSAAYFIVENASTKPRPPRR